MKKLYGMLGIMLLLALLFLPSLAFAAPTGALNLLAANGTPVTVADPATDVSNDFYGSPSASRPIWRHDTALQGQLGTTTRTALVYWTSGAYGGQDIYTYVYLGDYGVLYGGSVDIPLSANTSVTQTGGRLALIAGGSCNAALTGNTHVTISGGACGFVIGGSLADAYDGTPAAGEAASVSGNVVVRMNGGMVNWLCGSGAAMSRYSATGSATALTQGSVSVTINGTARIGRGICSGGYATVLGEKNATATTSENITLTIDLDGGAPGANILNANPNAPIVLLGGGMAEANGITPAVTTGGGATPSAPEVTVTVTGNSEVFVKSGTVYGVVAGGGMVRGEKGSSGGKAEANIAGVTVKQTGGYLLPVNGLGGALVGGGLTFAPAGTTSQPTYLTEMVKGNISVQISGGMTQNAIANGVMIGEANGVYSQTNYIRWYMRDQLIETIITGGSIKGRAGRYTVAMNTPDIVDVSGATPHSPTLPDGRTSVYRTAVLLHDTCSERSLFGCSPAQGSRVTQLTCIGASYGVNDVYTDTAAVAKERGGVYAWLPVGTATGQAIANGMTHLYRKLHSEADAHYGNTTANDDATWMVLQNSTPPSSVPSTGDQARPALWLALLLCVLCISAGLWRTRATR